jgi:hypothetical protein
MRFEFCHFAIRNYRNYGIRVTSRTEGAHGQLKAHLKNGISDLQKLHQAILRTNRRLYDKYDVLLQKELEKTPQDIKKHVVLKDLRHQVSHYALIQLGKQADKALEALKAGNDLPACTGTFVNQYGLPCAHRITIMLQSSSVLSQNDLDLHWRLPRDEVGSFASSIVVYTNYYLSHQTQRSKSLTPMLFPDAGGLFEMVPNPPRMHPQATVICETETQVHGGNHHTTNHKHCAGQGIRVG